MEVDARAAKFDLAVFMWEEPQGLTGVVNYRADLFDASTIRSLVQHFNILLQSIVAMPDAQVDALEMYTEEEKEQQTNKAASEREQQRRRLKAARRDVIDLDKSEAT
jgi:non-ribosomal peptide synthetase component F